MVSQSARSISEAADFPLFTGSAPVVTPSRALYSPKETAAILGISHATIYRLINAGRLDARKLLGKTTITAASIDDLVAGLPRAGRSV